MDKEKTKRRGSHIHSIKGSLVRGYLEKRQKRV